MHKLKIVRARRGLSQDELASRSGVAQATISRIEMGHTRVQARTLHKLAEALGCNIEDLVNGKG